MKKAEGKELTVLSGLMLLERDVNVGQKAGIKENERVTTVTDEGHSHHEATKYTKEEEVNASQDTLT